MSKSEESTASVPTTPAIGTEEHTASQSSSQSSNNNRPDAEHSTQPATLSGEAVADLAASADGAKTDAADADKNAVASSSADPVASQNPELDKPEAASDEVMSDEVMSPEIKSSEVSSPAVESPVPANAETSAGTHDEPGLAADAKTESEPDSQPGAETDAAPTPPLQAEAPGEAALTAEQVSAISERTRERIEKLANVIEQGLLSEAQSLCDRSQNAIHKLVRAKAAGNLEQQLAPLKARLTELLDWKRFADTEKKKSLIEQMSAVIDNDQNPPARAKLIKALQEEWRTLGHAEDNDRLWNEFSDASRKAFEPCKQYFRERKQIMRDNLMERTRICEQLESYAASIDEQAINVTEINQHESAARKAWKQYAPVAQSKIKQLQTRFNDVLTQLRRKRRDVLLENAKNKQQLIDEAKQLVEAEDLKQAINRAKAMQKEWKAIGPAPFRDERQYWQQFRAACDALFARLGDEPARPSGEQRRDNGKRSDDKKRASSAAAAPAPRINRRQQALVEEVTTRVEFCLELEAALLEGKALAAGNEELDSQWQGLAAVSDSELATHLQQRFEQILQLREDSATLSSAASHNAAKARKLCIEMEIQAGLPSPDEDKALRMQQQLAHLQQGFGQNTGNVARRSEALHRLKLEFACIGPLAPAVRGQLQPRVEQIR